MGYVLKSAWVWWKGIDELWVARGVSHMDSCRLGNGGKAAVIAHHERRKRRVTEHLSSAKDVADG